MIYNYTSCIISGLCFTEQAREEERKLEELKLQEERLVLTRVEELLLLSVEQKRESTGSFLDEEVTDVLFQFDSMVCVQACIISSLLCGGKF